MITSQHLREKQKNDGLFLKNDGLFQKKLRRFSDFVGDNRRNEREEKKRQNKKKEGIYTKESTAKTKRNPHKIGRKEGQFVHKSKDLRSNILMQT